MLNEYANTVVLRFLKDNPDSTALDIVDRCVTVSDVDTTLSILTKNQLATRIDPDPNAQFFNLPKYRITPINAAKIRKAGYKI